MSSAFRELRSVQSAGRISYEARGDESLEKALGSSRMSFEPARFTQLSISTGNLDNAAAEWEDWKTLHPCALDNFDRFAAEAAGKLVAVFLDYDGTLTPIVSNPDAAFMSEQMRDVVRRVAQLFPTAIISGRGREKVQSFVQLRELYYAGSHGMDIVGPDVGGSSANVAFQAAAHFAPLMDTVFRELEEGVAAIAGSSVEHNKFCVSVHFRNCAPADWPAVVAVVDKVAATHPELKVTRGRKVLEVRPQVDWDKGAALAHLLGALGLAKPGSVYAVYIGDDRTDEDAFRVLAERGLGAGVLVSSKVKPTAAAYTLRDPLDVASFLGRLVEWGLTASNLWRVKGGCEGWQLSQQLRLPQQLMEQACSGGAAPAGCAKDMAAALHVGDAAAAAAAFMKDGYRLPGAGNTISNGRYTAAQKLMCAQLRPAAQAAAPAAAALPLPLPPSPHAPPRQQQQQQLANGIGSGEAVLSDGRNGSGCCGSDAGSAAVEQGVAPLAASTQH